MPNIAFIRVVWVFGTVFLSETEKETYYRSMSLKVKIKTRYLNLEKNWTSVKHRQKMKQPLKAKVLND